MPTLYVNIHVPKNGGETFDTILRRNFGPGFQRAPDGRPGSILSAAEKEAFIRQRPALRCVSGHVFRWPAPPLPGVTYRYLTFLRHPVERLVSLYAYEQAHSPATHAAHRPLPEWIEARLAEDNALSNYQAFHILGATDPQAVTFAAARDRLADFFFVGLTEMFDASLVLLGRRLGLAEVDLWYEKKNVTDSKGRFPLDERTRQRLLDLNEIDMQLYDSARRGLEQALAALGPARLQTGLARLAAAHGHGPPAPPLRDKIGRKLRAWLRGSART